VEGVTRLSEIANELVAGCREGRAKANHDVLYRGDAVSVEAADMGQGHETAGLAMIFKMDAEDISSGRPSDMHEVAVYHVKDTRIVREEFFDGL
jgi:ketosteroid isomerase-like protein